MWKYKIVAEYFYLEFYEDLFPLVSKVIVLYFETYFKHKIYMVRFIDNKLKRSISYDHLV